MRMHGRAPSSPQIESRVLSDQPGQWRRWPLLWCDHVSRLPPSVPRALSFENLRSRTSRYSKVERRRQRAVQRAGRCKGRGLRAGFVQGARTRQTSPGEEADLGGVREAQSWPRQLFGAPGQSRTGDLSLRRRLLYPLSYWGATCRRLYRARRIGAYLAMGPATGVATPRVLSRWGEEQASRSGLRHWTRRRPSQSPRASVPVSRRTPRPPRSLCRSSSSLTGRRRR